MTVNIMKMLGKECLEKYFMTGQSLPLKMVSQLKMGFGNGQNLCFLQEITDLPCGTCAVPLQFVPVPLPDFISSSGIIRFHLLPQQCCRRGIMAKKNTKSLFPSQCKNLLNLRIRVSFCDIDLRSSAEESWLSMN